MLDPIYLILIFFGFTLLFMIGISAFVYDVRHILKELLNASKGTEHSTQGMWYISHDQKSAIEGVRYELQQQNKFIKKKDGVITSGPLHETDPVILPPSKTERRKKDKTPVTAALPEPDPGHDVTITRLPALSRESARG